MKNFYKDLEDLIHLEWLKVIDKIGDTWGNLIEIKFFIDGTNEFNEKYCYNSKQAAEFYYKGTKLKPDCYYMRPSNYYEPSIVEILHECMKQNTYKPDIKHLENKNNV